MNRQRTVKRGETSITDVMRADVMSGRLAPGSRLVELQLADVYGASRAAVRSAIVELEKEGLVEREVNKGATVRRISSADAVQINEVRRLVEVFVAERAAVVATSDERDELRGIGARMRAAVAAASLDEYSELNKVLHRRIREIARHEVAAEIIDNLRNRAAAFDIRLSVVPGRAERSVVEHQAIIDAIVNGDASAAARAAGDHISSVVDALRTWQQLPY